MHGNWKHLTLLNYFFQGFIFGIAYVAPIGPQNLFVINSSIGSNDIKYRLTIVFSVIFFDISLALSCFVGVGILFNHFPMVKLILLFLGFLIITFIGIKSTLKKTNLEYDTKSIKLSTGKIIAYSFSVAWLNPQAIIDGTMILGGMRATLPVNYAGIFILGVCFASVLWFNFLSLLSNKILSMFNKLARYINLVSGIIMILFGLKIGMELFRAIFIERPF